MSPADLRNDDEAAAALPPSWGLSPQGLALRMQERLAALMVLLATGLLIKHLWTGGETAAPLLLALLLWATATADWFLRRYGTVSEAFTHVLLVGGMLAAVAGVAAIHPNVAVYVLIAIPVIFIRLSLTVALVVSSLALGVTTVILAGYWDLPTLQYLHVPLGGGFLIATVAIGCATMNELYLESTRATRKAEALAQQKEDLMRTVSHEIRTPMNAVLGVTTLALKDAGDPAMREALVRVRQNAQHLVSLANNILDRSRIEAGQGNVEQATFALADVVDHVRDVVGRDCAAAGLTAVFDVAPELPAQVIGNRVGLTQLLLNYAANAIRFTRQGLIVVRLGIEGSGRGDGAKFLLRGEVQDTGVGLTEAQQAQLFRSFVQIGTQELRSGGAGLGLAICKWIAEQSQGQVGVTSQPGIGSTFWFTMQVEESTPGTGECDAPAATEARNLQGIRVLVVDDESVNRLVAGAILRRAGATVVEVDGGAAAVDAVRDSCPDVVLMDVQMPDLDGVDALHAIRQLPSGQCVPVVALTARVGTAERQRLLAAGMCDYLAKPFEVEEIEELVWTWTRGRRARPSGGESRVLSAPVEPVPLEELAGLEYQNGLRRFAGDAPLYVQQLRLFFEKHSGTIDAIAEALEAGDIEQASSRVHRITGSSGVLGLRSVHDAARALEAALVGGAEPSGCQPLADQLRHCFTSMRAPVCER